MSDSVTQQIQVRLQEKVNILLDERGDLRKRRDALDHRDRVIDRELADCVAGARALGVTLEIPEAREGQRVIVPGGTNMTIAEYMRRTAGDAHKLIFTPTTRTPATEAKATPPGVSVPTPPPGTIAAASAPPLPVSMPKVKDIALDRLKLAESGLRASAIRDYIEQTYRAQIHEKTVGMTLYRLLKEGKVYRKGITWFFGPAPEAETKNPGVSAPGPIDVFD